MTTVHLSKRKANAISNGIFLICLGVLFYTSAWWPGILVAIWALLATRQVLTRRFYDLFISSVILLGLFCVYYLKVTWDVLMPVLFVIGGIYIIFREFYQSREETEVEHIDDVEKEIEEMRHDK